MQELIGLLQMCLEILGKENKKIQSEIEELGKKAPAKITEKKVQSLLQRMMDLISEGYKIIKIIENLRKE